LTKIGRIIDIIIEWLAYISAVLMILTFTFVTVDVAMRYFFTRPLGWSTEFAEYSMATLTFFAAAWVLKKDAHVYLDIVLDVFNTRTQATINMITSILGSGICFYVTWWGLQAVIFHAQQGTIMAEKSMELLKAPLLTVLPI